MISNIAKMTGSIYEIEKEKMDQKILDFVDLIDSYNLIGTLSDSEFKEVKQEFLIHEVSTEKVQVVIGTNYRVNLFENGDLRVMFIVKGISHEDVDKFARDVDSLGFSPRVEYKDSHFQKTMKTLINIPKEVDIERIMKLLDLFKIQ